MELITLQSCDKNARITQKATHLWQWIYVFWWQLRRISKHKTWFINKNSIWPNAWTAFVAVPAPDTQPRMESKSLTLATATKALSVRTPEEINLLPPFPGLSAGLNRGQRAGRSSRRLGNVSLTGCKDKQITGMRRGLVIVMSQWFTPGSFRLIRDN